MNFIKISLISSLCFFLLSCERNIPSVLEDDFVYRKDMRNLVINLAQKARATDGNFIVIPQNGQEVVLRSFCQDCSTEIDQTYMNSINAIGIEHLFFGYSVVDGPNSNSQTQEVSSFLNLYSSASKPVFVTDYCHTPTFVDASYSSNQNEGYIAYAAPSFSLNTLAVYPAQPNNVNYNSVSNVLKVKNFGLLTDPSSFASKQSYLQTLSNSDYDLLIIDGFYKGELLSRAEVNILKTKAGGGTRLVMATMSVGQASEERYYWESDWSVDSEAWLHKEISGGSGSYQVNYWEGEWQTLLYSGQDSYLSLLLSSGFDGAYLLDVEVFKDFE